MSEEIKNSEAQGAQPERKKRIFSAIQPSGTITLGNYVGALRNWVKLQDDYDCIFAVADLHAITVRQDPKAFRRNILEAYALFLACGIDTEKSIFFLQSHVHTHAELAWLLNCYTQFGELSRMTQFKDKSTKHADNVNAVPDGYIPKVGARIKSLQDPTKKMSKSDENANAWVAILDKPETIMKKFKRAVTDSEAKVCVGEGKDGINNLIGIMSAVTGKTDEQITAEFEGKGYGDFKVAVAEAVIEEVRPIQERFDKLIADKAYLEEQYRRSAELATKISQRTLDKAMKKIGYVAR